MHDPAVTPAVHRLLDRPRFGTGLGLHRAMWLRRRAEAELQARFDAIKVTGSNGKGSVVAMTDAALRRLGARTGRTTSPHRLRFHERIHIDGQEISGPALAAAVAWAEKAVAACEARFPGERVGGFEAITATVLAAFAQAGLSNVVVEAGIGGRFDPARAFPGALAALTSVDLEHTALLGPTAEHILYDKADLCAPGGTLVVGRLSSVLAERLDTYCALRGVRVRSIATACQVSGVQHSLSGTTFRLTIPGVLDDTPVQIGSPGDHQVDNACVAALLIQEWAAQQVDGMAIAGALQRGLQDARLPGRFTRVHQDPDVIVDSAHTPAAAQALARTISQVFPRPPVLVLGISYNKDIVGIVGALLPVVSAVVITRALHQGAPIDALADTAQHTSTPILDRAATVAGALTRAMDCASTRGLGVVVAGGLFLAAEAQTILRGGDPRTLRFF